MRGCELVEFETALPLAAVFERSAFVDVYLFLRYQSQWQQCNWKRQMDRQQQPQQHPQPQHLDLGGREIPPSYDWLFCQITNWL